MEFFAWRGFRNRRELGACAGLTGTPYDSGGSKRDQGISKADNARVRTMMVRDRVVVAAPSAELQAQLLVHPVPPKSWASCPSGSVSALPVAARGCGAWGSWP
ncbi:MAG: transposase [Pseudomonadota bacterium]|nr:transposase [Pseudomonadota bacterium]